MKVTDSLVSEYWDRYALNLRADGAEWGSKEFFERIRQDHDRAYGFSNAIVDIPSHGGKSVLMLCCGIGLEAVEYARHGASVTFISPSPRLVELTERLFSYSGQAGDLRAGFAEELPFRDDCFDVVDARGILMFARDPGMAVEEIHRVVKPGGVVYAHLHNRLSWYALLVKMSGANFVQESGDPPVHRLHTVRDARRMFGRFSSVEIALGRFPTATRRSGLMALAFNKVVVPLVGLLPRSMVNPLGYYLLVTATK